MDQVIETSKGPVVFRDRREMVYSALCEPRDIEIVSGPQGREVLAEIAIDIRLSQGHPTVGVAQNLKY